MNLSIRQRIYGAFSLLVILFIINSICSLNSVNKAKQLSKDIFTILNPSLQSLEDFKDLINATKMHTINVVSLKRSQNDKDSLVRIIHNEYPKLKTKLNQLSAGWNNKQIVDSLIKVNTAFERLIVTENRIISLPREEAVEILEAELIPSTLSLINELSGIIKYKFEVRTQKNLERERSFSRLRILISILAITMIFVGLFLSIYMARMIIKPLDKIRAIVNDLGKGIIRKVDHKINKDEMGGMTQSVNKLAESLQSTISFVNEIGNRNFYSHYQPLSSEDSLGLALISMCNNIKLNDEKLNDAQHIAHIGSWERDIKTDKVTFSDEMFNIFDINPASFDFRFESIMKFVHPDDIERVADINRKNLYMEPVPYECKIITGKGVIKDVFIQTKVVLGKFAEIEKTFGVVQDITERKQAEEKINAEKELFRLMIESMPDQIYLKDAESRFLLCNKQVAAGVGLKLQEEMIGKTDFDFFPEEMANEFSKEEKQLMKTGKSVINREGNIIDKTTGKLRWSLTTKVPLRNGSGKIIGLIGINRDITERKLDEELLKKSERILETKNKELEIKNRELEQFAYVASHDLQEPLRTTTSFVEIFKQQYYGRIDEKADKYLNYIVQASDRMRVLIKDLLDFSRIGNNKDLEQIDCNLLLQDVVADIDKAIKESNAEIKADPLPVVNGYTTELKQLFQNLIVNSIKFRKKDVAPKIKIMAEKKNDHWRFAFSDNGIGIDRQHNERIFIIFQRLHNRTEYQGSGIGLSHCKKIVELHNGKIWVDSTPNVGSTFNFTIQAN